jgi:hypothetical protein
MLDRMVQRGGVEFSDENNGLSWNYKDFISPNDRSQKPDTSSSLNNKDLMELQNFYLGNRKVQDNSQKEHFSMREKIKSEMRKKNKQLRNL